MLQPLLQRDRELVPEVQSRAGVKAEVAAEVEAGAEA